MYKVDRGVRIGFSQEDGEENGEETACVKGPMGKRLAYVRKKTQIRHDAVSQGVGKAMGVLREKPMDLPGSRFGGQCRPH